MAPEWALGRAWSDYRAVSFLYKRFKSFREEDKVPWSRTHTYFANMGGFAVKFSENTCQVELGHNTDAQDPASTTIFGTSELAGPSNPRTLTHQQHHSVIPGENGASEEISITNEDSSLPELPVTSTLASRVLTNDENGTSDETSILNEGFELDTMSLASALVPRVPASSRSMTTLQDEPLESSPGVLPVQKTNSRTQIDEERGDLRRDQIPEYIQKFLEQKRRSGVFPAESFEEPMKNLSEIIGSTGWKPDSNNMRNIKKCLDIITMEHFEGDWEKRQFRYKYKHWFYNLVALQGDLWALDAHQLLVARKLGVITNLPNVRTDELDDKNKGDALIKVLALGQVVWFFIQMGMRLRYHLPTSQLEIVALSFAICIGLVYGLLLGKPQDASTAIIVSAARYPTAEQMISIAIAGPSTFGSSRRSVWIPNDAIHQYEGARGMAKLNQGVMVAVTIFGGVHCVAWEFDFPTQVEQLLWRICSTATIALLPLGIAICEIIDRTWRRINSKEGRPQNLQLSIDLVWKLTTFAFIVCRMFIIVEVVRSLVDLPIEAFRSTWSKNLPHLG